MKFGKYKGRTYKQIFANHKKYVRWIIKQKKMFDRIKNFSKYIQRKKIIKKEWIMMNTSGNLHYDKITLPIFFLVNVRVFFFSSLIFVYPSKEQWYHYAYIYDYKIISQVNYLSNKLLCIICVLFFYIWYYFAIIRYI